MTAQQALASKMDNLDSRNGAIDSASVSSFNPRPSQNNPNVKGKALKMHGDMTKRPAGGSELHEHNQAGKSMSVLIKPGQEIPRMQMNTLGYERAS